MSLPLVYRTQYSYHPPQQYASPSTNMQEPIYSYYLSRQYAMSFPLVCRNPIFILPSPCYVLSPSTLQRQNAENLKQIFPEKEYRGLSPNFLIRVSVSEIYIHTMCLPVLLEEICRLILGIYKSLTDT